MTTLLIVLAGACGCVARWSIEQLVHRWHPQWRSWATLSINAVGAAIAGFVIFASYRSLLDPGTVGATNPVGLVQLSTYGTHEMSTLSPYLLTGFCGGFTTFSSAIALPYLEWRHGARLRTVANIALTPVLCFVGFAAGEMVARHIG